MPATFTIATDAGCQSSQVRGVVGTDSLFGLSFWAMDFGDVVVGTVSEPQTVTFLLQADRPDPPDSFGFGTYPEDIFEVIGKPAGVRELSDCEPVNVQVRFRAPDRPGPVEEGQLGYSIGPGDGGIQIFGRAVLPPTP